VPVVGTSDVTGPLGSIFTGVSQQNLNDWLQAALISILNNQRAAQEFGQNAYISNQNPLRDLFLGGANAGQGFLWGGGEGGPGILPQTWDMQQPWAQGGLLDLARNLGQWTTPEMEGAQSGIQGLAQGGAGGGPQVMPTAAQLFLGGGWSQPGQNILDRAMDIGTGRGWEMGQQADTGGQLLGREGQTAFTRGLMDYANQALQWGGQTPLTQQMAEAGQGGLAGMFGTGGLTPTGAVGEGAALQGLLQQGASPISAYMQQLGATQAADEPLLPFETVLSFARDTAGRASAQQRQAYMQRALARGGGPGATVASGLQNQGMREFSDAAMAQEADAVQKALLERQALMLQRQAQGGQLAQSQGALENQRLGINAGLLGNLEDMASRRWLGAGGLLGQAQGQQTALQSELGRLGLGGLGAETQRMQLGGSLLDQYNRQRLGGLGQAEGALEGMNRMALGGGGLYNQLLGTQGGLYDTYINNLLTGGALGNQRFGNISQAQNQAFSNLGGVTNTAQTALSNIYAPWTGMANNQLNFAGGRYGSETNLFNPMFSDAYGNREGAGVRGWTGGLGDLAGSFLGF